MKFDEAAFKTHLNRLSEAELDAILDRRDEPEFDDAWCEADRKFGHLAARHPRAEEVFQQLSAATRGHEIVSYIADDLDLIACYELAKAPDRFMAFLVASYEAGHVPGSRGLAPPTF